MILHVPFEKTALIAVVEFENSDYGLYRGHNDQLMACDLSDEQHKQVSSLPLLDDTSISHDEIMRAIKIEDERSAFEVGVWQIVQGNLQGEK
jgi:hypothetical protein